jgi:predicted permease
VNTLARWLQRLIRPERSERQLDAELRFHYDTRVAEHIAAGMSADEARRAARIEFGGAEQIKDACRDVRRSAPFDSLLQDVRQAFRGMRRAPGFTAVAVTMLAVGMGANALVFSIVTSVLFKGFPGVARNDRLLYMTTGRNCCVSYPDFRDWQTQATTFDGMALVHGFTATLGDEGTVPQRFTITEVTSETFRLVGQKPMLGRDFTAADEAPGAAPVAVLRYSFWSGQYARDPAIVGRTVRINRIPTTVIGVMPPGFSFPQNQDLWVPLAPTPEILKRSNRDTWFVLGRMKDGITIDTARADIETIAARLAVAYPETNANLPPQAPRLPQVATFREFFIGESATRIYQALWGSVGFVLLIACANLANLLLARTAGRAHEISVRVALGAGRWRVVRQLLIESVMLSALGGVAAWSIVQWGVRVFALFVTGSSLSDATGSWFDQIIDYSLDYRVFVYLVAVSIGAGLLFGLAPARRLSRLDVNTTLKDGGRSVRGNRGGRRLSALLVTGELALAVVLLAGAGLMIRSFIKVSSADLGVQSDNVATALVSLPMTRYPTPASQTLVVDRMQSEMRTIPGVESTAIADEVPGQEVTQLAYDVGDAPRAAAQRPRVGKVAITPGYFHTLGAHVVAGREFTDADNDTSVPVAIVNQRFAAQRWPGQNPVGKRLRLVGRQQPEPWRTIVGVASNIVQSRTRRDNADRADPLVYVPYRQRTASNVWLIARLNGSAGALAPAFVRVLQRVDAELPMSLGPIPLAELIQRGYQYKAFTTVLFGIFAALALMLAVIGLYAVVAHAVSKRTQEIGIRLALGATARDILALVFMEGMPQLGIGLVVGLGASLAVNRVLESQLVLVSPSDPATLSVVAIVLIVTATLGCWIPARRAMRTDPLDAIRRE